MRKICQVLFTLLAIAGVGLQCRGDDAQAASRLQTSQHASEQNGDVWPGPPQPVRPPRPSRPLTPEAAVTPRQESAGQSSGFSDDAFQLELQPEDEPQELSIEPGSQPLLPADAPAWIGALPDTSGEVHFLYVGGLIAETPSAAARLLDEALVSAVESYVEETVLQRPGGAAALQRQLTPDFIWKNLIDDPQGYTARLNTSGIPMYQAWVTVSITPQQRDMIKRWNREAMQRKRLASVGVGVLGGLACVGLLHLVLKGRKPQL